MPLIAGMPHFELIYVLTGIAVPLIMQMGVKKIGEGLMRLRRQA